MKEHVAATDLNQACQIFWIFLCLGCTSFGGPIAHLAYFHQAFVRDRRWLSEQAYSELVALCQFFPGPASSQVGFALGQLRGGTAGAVAAWLGFTLPSAILMTAAGMGLIHLATALPEGLIAGLKIVAVAVIAQAVWGMSQPLLRDYRRLTMLFLSTLCMLILPGSWTQLTLIVIAGLLGACLLNQPQNSTPCPPVRIKRLTSTLALLLFITLLCLLPLIAAIAGTNWQLAHGFFQSGALVFGGGHVVLPLLDSALVQTGFLSNDDFLTGYGLAQAMPGPLFTVAAFYGATIESGPGGIGGSLLALCMLFLPGLLLVWAVLPHWASLRSRPRIAAALLGVNAAVTGLLLAALYQPVWLSSVTGPAELVLAVVAFLALTLGKQPPWRVVLLCPMLGWLLL